MKVLAVSGSRADWGLLQPVLRLLQNDPSFILEILVTGQHLMPNISSMQEIKRAGFDIKYHVKMGLQGGEKASALCSAYGRVVAGTGKAILEGKPDLMLVLGDRYEILGAVTAALLSKIPVAHVAGGDVTEGAFDDSIRHAITKMSSLHFTTTEEAKTRICQMGEPSQNVFVTGSPGIDQIQALQLMSRAEFFDSVRLKPQKKNFLITLHPATLASDNLKMAHSMLEALNPIKDTGFIFTGSNADPEAEEIDRIIQAWVEENDNAVFHTTLGSKRYFSALEHCDLVLGNSSSGIYEAPSFRIPTVNIGDRQARRVRAISVVDCDTDTKSIQTAIQTAMSGNWSGVTNPFGDGRAAEKILAHLRNIADPNMLIRKSFTDLKYE